MGNHQIIFHNTQQEIPPEEHIGTANQRQQMFPISISKKKKKKALV